VPSYTQLREHVSHRVRFRYDTGAEIVGYLAFTSPAEGPVELVVLSDVDVIDAHGRVLLHRDEMSFVPNVLTGFAVAEGAL
jgi:hypothetical protein